jgi:serine phosphatase RsbU (regulator of sigma subunit)
VVSDGVHDAAPGGGRSYGETALAGAIRSARLTPPAQAIGAVMRALRDYHGDVELEDDAVMVCLDRVQAGTVDQIGPKRMAEAAPG